MSELRLNPHPPFPAPEIPARSTDCDLGCLERYTPKKLREVDLFKKIDFLGCHYEDMWTDHEIRTFLTELDEFFRKSLSGDLQILNWYSLMSWLEASQSTWENAAAGNFGIDNEDFYSRYDLTLQDIWLSMSAANDEEFTEDGFHYYEWMLKPYIGTNLIQRKIIEKLEIDAEVVDWYQNKSIINGYSFVMENFPGWEKARLLIINSKLLKNAESILVSLRDSRCPTRLLLSDGGHLDRDYLSDISALKFEGVHICFQRYHKYLVDFFTLDDLDVLIHKLYSSEHMYLVDFFRTTELSIDYMLDGLADRTVFLTKTNIWPTKQIQLLPAWAGNPIQWSGNITWEDHYIWGSVDITNLIRTILPYEGLFVGKGWPEDATWERWADWHGEQNSSWRYKKPITTADPRRTYFEDPNYIPGFEPSSGFSTYRPLVNVGRERISVENVFSNKSQVINYWDEWFLSKNEFISPTVEQEPIRRKLIYFGHNANPTEFAVDYSIGGFIYDHYSDENIVFNKFGIDYWERYPMSSTKRLSPEEENQQVAYIEKTRRQIITNANHTIVAYWDQWMMSETESLSDKEGMGKKSIVMTHGSETELDSVSYSFNPVIFDHESFENIRSTNTGIDFWNVYKMSDKKSLSTPMTMEAEDQNLVRTTKTSTEILPDPNLSVNTKTIYFWDVYSLSGSKTISTPMTMATEIQSSIRSSKTRIDMNANLSLTSKGVYFWDVYPMSETKSISTPDTMDAEVLSTIRTTKTSTEILPDENLSTTTRGIDFWNSYAMSGSKTVSTPITMSEEDQTLIRTEKTSSEIIMNANKDVLNYWEEYLMSENVSLSTSIDKMPENRVGIFGKHTSL